MTESELEQYSEVVEAVLKKMLGEAGAKALLYYTGKPDPATFDAKLRSVLGDGAQIILRELKRRTDAGVSASESRFDKPVAFLRMGLGLLSVSVLNLGLRPLI